MKHQHSRPGIAIQVVFTLAVAAMPISALATTQQDAICARTDCTTSATVCPGGSGDCRAVTSGSDLGNACPAKVGRSLCLSAADVTCASQPTCLSGLAPGSASGTAAGTAIGTSASTTPFIPVVPQLSTPIPGLVFTPASKSQNEVTISYLAQYISAAYRYLIGLSVIAATIMVIYGGFRYLLGSSYGDIKRGKEIISDAVTGMILVFAAYLILNTVNSDTTSLHALVVPTIQTLSINDILNTDGSQVEGLDYSQESDIPATAAPGAAGSWRRDMLAACGQRNGFSLPTLQQRIDRYRAIVQTWARVGGDQGGAIYLRGGSQDCSDQHAEKTFLFDGIAGHWPQSLVNQYFPSGSNCHDVIAQGQTQRQTLSTLYSQVTQACYQDMTHAYETVLMQPARTNGLLCGDCASFTYSMLNCFGRGGYGAINGRGPGSDCHTGELVRNADGTRSYPPNPRYAFRIWLGDTPRGAARTSALHGILSDPSGPMSQLQFGDVIIWHGPATHVYSYTGGVGLPFQILEMGGGGANDQTAGGELASRNAGLPYNSAGVRTHPDAARYIGQVAADCIWAVHILDPAVNPLTP